MKRISPLNAVFSIEVILFFGIIFGVLPREFAFVLAGLLIIYSLFASLENATVLFVRSIPLFIALPFTASFDNFNTWRILALIIFLRWSIPQARSWLSSKAYRSTTVRDSSVGIFAKIHDRFAERYGLALLFFISILSIFVAQ